MSGPKGGAYQVVSAEELERRALETARNRLSRFAQELRDLSKALSAYDNAPQVQQLPAAAREATSREVNQLADRAEALVRTTRGILTDIRVAAAIAATPKIRLNLSIHKSTSAHNAASASVARAAAPDDHPVKDLVARAEQAVANALPALDEKAVAQLAAKLDGLRSVAGTGRASIAYDDLCFHIAGLKRDHRLRQKWVESRDALLAALDRCTGQEAQGVRRQLLALPEGSVLPVSLEYVESLARREAAEADAEYVDAAVAEVLAELGYEVGHPPKADLPHGVHLAIPGYPRHLARVERRSSDLAFWVVGVGGEPTDPREDLQAETVACQSFEQLQDRLAVRGVNWDVTTRFAPGERTVAHIEAPAVVITARPREYRREREREREL